VSAGSVLDPRVHCNCVSIHKPARGEVFRRDAPTLFCYGVLAGYAFWLYAFGPALALLQAELHLSYTMLGVYSALWSAGAVLVGASFAGLARRLPRAALLWYSAAGATAGAVLFAVTHTSACPPSS
jgi:hypothetical protein